MSFIYTKLCSAKSIFFQRFVRYDFIFGYLVIYSLLLIPVHAGVFQWTDANGQKHYSDKLKLGAKKLNINAGYSFYQVKKVFDGDTILLGNGSKVRLLSVNTPEVEGRNKLAQPLGVEAKNWLQSRLENQKVRLELDVEEKDKYGRVLAHVFTEDKQHINLALLNHGLASLVIHPPNLKYKKILLAAQQNAERKGLAIWSNEHYKVKQVEDLIQKTYTGWQRVSGQVKTIRKSRKYMYLALSDHFSLKIKRQSENLFPDLQNYLDKNIEARGWIHRQKNNYNMRVLHPSAIKDSTIN